jgi:hypothetical protein
MIPENTRYRQHKWKQNRNEYIEPPKMEERAVIGKNYRKWKL